MSIPEAARHLPEAMDAITPPGLATHCFGCGPDNPEGLHLTFTIDLKALTATAQVNLTRLHEGPPGYIHGGIIATLLDEAMSKVNRPLNVVAMTRHLQIDYLRPCPLNQPLTLTGLHDHREGRKLYHRAELTDAEGTILVQATGLFIVIDPKLLQP